MISRGVNRKGLGRYKGDYSKLDIRFSYFGLSVFFFRSFLEGVGWLSGCRSSVCAIGLFLIAAGASLAWPVVGRVSSLPCRWIVGGSSADYPTQPNPQPANYGPFQVLVFVNCQHSLDNQQFQPGI